MRSSSVLDSESLAMVSCRPLFALSWKTRPMITLRTSFKCSAVGVPMLAPADYEITEAENGEQALAAIAKQRPDLILMDIQLPIMDGYTATSRIKSDPKLRSIPIIAVTSYVLSGEEKKARAVGCDDCVTKPFSPRQLLPKIRQYIPQ